MPRNGRLLRSANDQILRAGVAAAVFATFSWALNFLSPYMMGAFGPIDFITLRFIVSGCIGLVMLRIY